MNEDFKLLPVTLLKQQTMAEVKKCNDYTSKYGLSLSDGEIALIIENRKEALESNGRIEFGGGVIQKLITQFADSPYISQDNYVSTLIDLQECFYYFKNEGLEDITDDELIEIMKIYYDGDCQGSVEYLQSAKLENICRDTRYGSSIYQDTDGYEDDYTDFFDYDE